MLSLLEGSPKKERDSGEDAEVRARDDEGDGGRRLVCAGCSHVITTERARVEVAGHHRHVCTNPSGVPFDIGCFSLAPGCIPRGPFESYWTWFPGFDWQIVLCGGCMRHLGWGFRHADGSSFVGLILPRIVEARSDEE
jgi:hypothetical protein